MKLAQYFLLLAADDYLRNLHERHVADARRLMTAMEVPEKDQDLVVSNDLDAIRQRISEQLKAESAGTGFTVHVPLNPVHIPIE